MNPDERLLVFVRHGEAVSSTDIWDADGQRPLTRSGQVAAASAAEELMAFGADKLYSSPSLRTRQTAEQIADRIEPETRVRT